MSNGESYNLEAHVAACAERYKTIFRRLTRIEYVLWTAACALIAGLGGMVVAMAMLIARLGLTPH